MNRHATIPGPTKPHADTAGVVRQRSDDLVVGAANGVLEQEASRAASDVLSTTPFATRAAPPLNEQPERVSAFAAPPSVRRAIQGPGEPLPDQTRAIFEARFRHDFGRVRVHHDAAAALSADDIEARAYTVGSHIAFARGSYAPQSADGSALLAHELAHVIQQEWHGPLVQREQRAPGRGSGASAPVRSATAEERRWFVRTAIEFLQGQIEFFLLVPERPIPEVLRALRQTAEGGLRALAGLRDPLEQTLRTTYRDAVRQVLAARTRARPGAIHAAPSLQSLYEANRDYILPFALPVGRTDPLAAELSTELEAPLPPRPTRAERTRHAALQQARQRVRVVTGQVAMDVASLFDTRVARRTESLPPRIAVRFASGIPAGQHQGLSNVAALLAGGTLGANTTVMLALDLSAFGGGYDAYRFTRLDLGRALGSEILVERQGRIGIEGLRAEERRTMRQRFDRLGFRAAGFSQDELDQVLIGLSRIPDAQLGTLGNLRFARAGSDPDHPDAAGHYDQAAHTIRLFDRAFSSGLTRLGTGERPLTLAAHAVVHEVGHALDLSALRTTAGATATAERALLGEFGTGGRGYRIPDPRDPERARYDQLQQVLGGAQRAESAARSRSGARWSGGTPSEVTDRLARGARQPAFRQAAIRDGAIADRRGFPTTYPNPESFWQEYFAESFALYRTSPDLLRQLRPNVFAFMQRELP